MTLHMSLVPVPARAIRSGKTQISTHDITKLSHLTQSQTAQIIVPKSMSEFIVDVREEFSLKYLSSLILICLLPHFEYNPSSFVFPLLLRGFSACGND